MTDLEPLAPSEGVDMYLQHRESELSKHSYRKQKQRLQSFLRFCETEDIDNLNDLGGRDIHRFRLWRKQGNDYYDSVKTSTVRANLATLRVFIGFCESIDAVESRYEDEGQTP